MGFSVRDLHPPYNLVTKVTLYNHVMNFITHNLYYSTYRTLVVPCYFIEGLVSKVVCHIQICYHDQHLLLAVHSMDICKNQIAKNTYTFSMN